MEAKMTYAVHHHHHNEESPHAMYWVGGICVAVLALAAFVVAHSGTGMWVADSGSALLPLLW
jgi:hypothetical protein